jgi:cytochrome c oxidase assembly factor CtaG
VATVLHGIAIWVWHIPTLLDATIESSLMHRLQHGSFLMTALFFWWAIIRRPVKDYGLGAAHVFATMVHTGLLGALLTLAPRIFYPLQTLHAPEFGLTPLEDQQLAGLFMWVPGGAVYLGAGLYLLALWLGNASGSWKHQRALLHTAQWPSLESSTVQRISSVPEEQNSPYAVQQPYGPSGR